MSFNSCRNNSRAVSISSSPGLADEGLCIISPGRSICSVKRRPPDGGQRRNLRRSEEVGLSLRGRGCPGSRLRSPVRGAESDGAVLGFGKGCLSAPHVSEEGPHHAGQNEVDHVIQKRRQVGTIQPVHPDRKSTRLNSSHMSISY